MVITPDDILTAKSVFDMFRSAIGLAKDAADALPEGEKKEAVEAALVHASVSAQTAQAQLAQSLGYELCRCQFPPTPMLQVGYTTGGADPGKSRPVYECPVCKGNTATPWRFTRTVPEKE